MRRVVATDGVLVGRADWLSSGRLPSTAGGSSYAPAAGRSAVGNTSKQGRRLTHCQDRGAKLMVEVGSNAEGSGAISQERISELLDRLCVSPGSNLITVLQGVQDEFGYLPRPALEEISERTKTPLSRIYGVISFYAQFYTEPRGRYTIRCCRGTACHVKGSSAVLNTVKRVLGIDEGQTTPDLKFYLETVACLGTCFLAPAIMIGDQYYGKLNPQRVESILKSYGAKECPES
ncbi:MAG: NAD(P)H-dependent oxidoreductase subunit E [Armatimonadota bacterium]